MSKSKLFLRKMYNIKRATAIAKMFAYFRQIFKKCVLTLKMVDRGVGERGCSIDPSCGFSKKKFCRERMNHCFFVTFNIIISHIFPENFIKNPHIVQRIWRFFPPILTIFIAFLDSFMFPCYKETNDHSIFLLSTYSK